MSIYGEITRITDNFSDAYDMCSIKGAVMPTSANQNSNNLPATVLTIPAEGYGDMLDNYIMGSINIIETDAATVKKNAFNNDISINEVKLNSATIIDEEAFSGCSSLKSISMPLVTQIGAGAFKGCTNLLSINAPNLTSIDNATFQDCSALTSVNVPELRTLVVSDFSRCISLTSINLPKATEISARCFNDCTALSRVDLGKATKIEGAAFYNCSQLSTLIIRTTTKCVLEYDTAFTGTPFESGSSSAGTLYVPSDLVGSYQQDSTWNGLHINILPIS